MLPRSFIGDANGRPKSISGGRLPCFGRLPHQLISETAATGRSDDVSRRLTLLDILDGLAQRIVWVGLSRTA